jgi:hypothetical protein
MWLKWYQKSRTNALFCYAYEYRLSYEFYWNKENTSTCCQQDFSFHWTAHIKHSNTVQCCQSIIRGFNHYHEVDNVSNNHTGVHLFVNRNTTQHSGNVWEEHAVSQFKVRFHFAFDDDDDNDDHDMIVPFASPMNFVKTLSITVISSPLIDSKYRASAQIVTHHFILSKA